MNLPASQEPPNGDFVAYVEQLQRESLARHVSGQPHPGNTSHTMAGEAAPPTASASVLSADQARELISALGGGNYTLEQVLPLAAITLGVLGLVITLIGSRGPFAFFISVGLIIWGAKRIEFLKKKPAA